MGYKNGLVLGLIISLWYIVILSGSNTGSYPLMLAGLFTVGLGFSLQQTVANPLAIALGPVKTGSKG